MILHVSRNLQSAFIASIPRDSYVDIPASGDWKGGKNKINSAFAFGGAKLAAKTVFNLTKVPLDGAMIVYMTGVGEMVKELGDVNVCVDEPVRSNDGSKVWTKGCHDMKSDEALEFMRQRKQLRGGDFSRIHDQQLVIKALATKIFTKGMLTDPVELDKLVSLAAESVTVDQDMNIRDLVFAMKGIKPANIKFATAPFTNASLKTDAGEAVELDLKGTQELFQAVIDDKTDAWLTAHPQKVPTL
jgi:LCP family protein required for cell wall assembly